MSRPAFSLAIRSLAPSRPATSQWICRRCLATQTPGVADKPDGPIIASPPPSDPAAYDPTLPASQRIGPDGKPYRLKRSDFILKKPFTAHAIPAAYLQHSTSPLLPPGEKAQREQTETHKPIVGTVVSSGKMDKTVRVRVGGQTWNKRIGKYFHSHQTHLVHDPNNSLHTGDVVSLHRLNVSRRVNHVVASVISPFGPPLSARPPIPTPDERLAAYKEKRFAKIRRRELRVAAAEGNADAIAELEAKALEAGHGVRPGVGRGNVGIKGVRLGNKGQKLGKGVLPGGFMEVGGMGKRSVGMKRRERKEKRAAERSEREAKQMGGQEGREGAKALGL